MKSLSKVLTSVFGVSAVVTAAIFATPAAATDSVNGQTCASIGAGLDVGSGAEVYMTLAAGDVLTVVNNTADSSSIRPDGSKEATTLGGLATVTVTVTEANAGDWYIGRLYFQYTQASGMYSATINDTSVVSASAPAMRLSCSNGPTVSVKDAVKGFTPSEIIGQTAALQGSVAANLDSVFAGAPIAQVTNNGFTFSTAGGADGVINGWANGTVTAFNGDEFDGNQINLTLGMDKMAADGGVYGALIGVGKTDFDTLVSDVAGTFISDSVTVGVYYGRKTGNLTFDAMLAYSDVGYEVTSGTVTGEFDAKRLAFATSLRGETTWGNVRVEPTASFLYVAEDQEAYTDSASNSVAAVDVTAGRVALGPKMFFAPSGDTTTWLQINAEYDFNSVDTTTLSLVSADDTFSGRIRAGMLVETGPGTLDMVLDLGGLGGGVYTSVGVGATYRFEF